jgi:hypothetical protein
MPKLISTWTHGSRHWTEFLADDGRLAVHCVMNQPTTAEVAEAYEGIPLMQRESCHSIWPFHFSMESDDPMILSIAREHGVLVQSCSI